MKKPLDLLKAVGSCVGCKYWRREEGEREALDYGDCRRYPPSVFMSEDEDGGAATVAIWPVTTEGEGCGEFSPSN